MSGPSTSSCGTPAAPRAADSSRSSSICQGATARVSSPVASRSQSMPSRATSVTRPARFSWPRRRSRGISSGHRERPLPSPWVSDAEQNPPLRPVAFSASRVPSRSRTEEPGSASSAVSAAQRPVKPPPTTTVSTEVAPVRAGRGAGRSGSSSQKGIGAAACQREELVIAEPPTPPTRRSTTSPPRWPRLWRSG